MSGKGIRRRDFFGYSALIAAGLGTSGTPAGGAEKDAAKLKKALQLRMLPRNLGDRDKFELAYRCGFRGIEGRPMGDLKAAEELAEIARDAGTPFHSLSYGGWGAPLSDPRPDVQEKGLAQMRAALKCAQVMGCDAVLLVPAVVNETVGYKQAYERSQRNIRKLIPAAENAGVVIAVENVWNKFLLSPLEFARYVDEFDSEWVRAYFDVGNVILFGYSQDWIRTLGKRIVKIHLKDFKRDGHKWTNLLEGDVNWKQVRAALGEIGYEGYLTPELRGGDEAYLSGLSERIDKIVAAG